MLVSQMEFGYLVPDEERSPRGRGSSQRPRQKQGEARRSAVQLEASQRPGLARIQNGLVGLCAGAAREDLPAGSGGWK